MQYPAKPTKMNKKNAKIGLKINAIFSNFISLTFLKIAKLPFVNATPYCFLVSAIFYPANNTLPSDARISFFSACFWLTKTRSNILSVHSLLIGSQSNDCSFLVRFLCSMDTTRSQFLSQNERIIESINVTFAISLRMEQFKSTSPKLLTQDLSKAGLSIGMILPHCMYCCLSCLEKPAENIFSCG